MWPDSIDIAPFEDVCIDGKPIYQDIDAMLRSNPELGLHTTKAVVFLVNWKAGFGSALGVFVQNLAYLHKLNPSLIVLPHFSKNHAGGFKYHDPNRNNSFFLYFQRRITPDIAGLPLLICHSTPLSSFPRLNWQHTPPCSCKNTRLFLDFFREQYSLRIDTSPIDAVIRGARGARGGGRLLGLHMRSYAQKRIHLPQYQSSPMNQRLLRLKASLESDMPYQLFVASDVREYLELARSIFGRDRVHCLSVHRASTAARDSTLDWAKYTGLGLGWEILADCYGLAMCDRCYVSPSNIQLLISIIKADTPLIEY